MFNTTDDVRIEDLRPLISPAILMEELPLTAENKQLITSTREQATAIVQKRDPRLLAIVGPCSIHDPALALAYAHKLLEVKKELENELLIIMRVYFEKPRTTVGWKGLINDPDLNGAFNINRGLHVARKLLLDLTNIGMPCGTEFLDTIIPQFIADLISWGAIGARTTESQVHRELASGLSMPIGFKNGTGGSTQIAIDAIGAALHKHRFLSVTKQGISAIVTTKGNDACHIILRGSSQGPNYDQTHIKQAAESLTKAQLQTGIMVDCSHGNGRKDHTKQPIVAADIAEQLKSGDHNICGVMFESNINEGNQPLNNGHDLQYGVSITDACMSFEQTVPVLKQLAEAVKIRNRG